jgi:4-hydroxy-4-methyl-2-oxoglutarate aldolase
VVDGGFRMKPVIIRNIERPDEGLVRKLGEFGVATVHEAQGRTGLMLPYMRPVYLGARLTGPAVTVYSHPGDNLMIHAALEQCRKGDVLVITTKSESTDGMFGELLATSCQAHGVAGVVIEAGVRDVADITAMQFPVFSRAISSMGTVKETAGSVNIEIVCAGAIVHPGDIIVADTDGVVVVPRRDAAEVVRSSEERLAKEARNREQLKSGKLGLDMYGLRAKLKALGVEYLDRAPE